LNLILKCTPEIALKTIENSKRLEDHRKEREAYAAHIVFEGVCCGERLILEESMEVQALTMNPAPYS